VLPIGSGDVESIQVDHDAKQRLNDPDYEYRDVVAASPEESTEHGDDGDGDHEN
jgi:hypothetical protein